LIDPYQVVPLGVVENPQNTLHLRRITGKPVKDVALNKRFFRIHDQ